MKIVVNTPNGQIGNKVASSLLQAGHEVVIVTRDASRSSALIEAGAHAVVGSVDETDVLREAFAGADGLFWVTPPSYHPEFREWVLKMTEQAVALAKQAGVKRVALISSVGAQHEAGAGPISFLHPVETLFRESGLSTTSLQAAYFMENLLRDAATIKADGVFYGGIDVDVTMPMVATRDVAAAAVEVLTDSTWSGWVERNVLGPMDVTMPEVASTLSEVLGREIRYVPVGVEGARAGMKGAGFPDFLVELFAEMIGSLNTGHAVPQRARTAESTTPTTLGEWVAENAAAFG